MTHPQALPRETICDALEAVYCLTLLRDVVASAPAQAVLKLLQALVAREPDAATIAQAYSYAFAALAEATQSEGLPASVPDVWQAYLVTRLVDSENTWSVQAEMFGVDAIGAGTREQARRDLRVLQRLFVLHAESLWETARTLVAQSFPNMHDAWMPWLDLAPTQREGATPRDTLIRALVAANEWEKQHNVLERYWATQGTGLFARYCVFRWQGHAEGLRGIVAPDPIGLANLIGYEREKARLRANLENFVRGLPAHDTVLYGAPGTGKSSTVKALANAYTARGLRLIEVRKEHISDLPIIIDRLRRHAPHFLLFIDDLSFDEHETEYKALKVFLEGTVEMRPRNVLIYATTNRLNLIRENFADRGKPSEDVHWRDTLDARRKSLARGTVWVTRYIHDTRPDAISAHRSGIGAAAWPDVGGRRPESVCAHLGTSAHGPLWSARPPVHRRTRGLAKWKE